jgi:hypothetical protein
MIWEEKLPYNHLVCFVPGDTIDEKLKRDLGEKYKGPGTTPIQIH